MTSVMFIGCYMTDDNNNKIIIIIIKRTHCTDRFEVGEQYNE